MDGQGSVEGAERRGAPFEKSVAKRKKQWMTRSRGNAIQSSNDTSRQPAALISDSSIKHH